MRARTNLLVGCVAGASIVAAAYAVLVRLSTPGDMVSIPPPAMVDAERLEDARLIRIGRDGRELLIEQSDDVWRLPALGGYEANQVAVNSWLDRLRELRIIEPRTANPELLPRLGLDHGTAATDTAGATVEVSTPEGSLIADLVVGKSAPEFVLPGRSALYLRQSDGDQAWVAQGALPLSLDIQDWIDPVIFELAPDDIRSLTFVDGQNTPIQIVRQGSGRFDIVAADEVLAPSVQGYNPLIEAFSPLMAVNVMTKTIAAEREPVFLVYLSLKNRLLIEIEVMPLSADNSTDVTIRSFLADRVGLDPYRASSLQDRVEILNETRGNWLFRLPPETGMLLRQTFDELQRLAEASTDRS